jgi:hypothetical protein
MAAISSVTEMGRGDGGRAPVAGVVKGFHGEAPPVEAEGIGAGEEMRRPTGAPPRASPWDRGPAYEGRRRLRSAIEAALLSRGGWECAEYTKGAQRRWRLPKLGRVRMRRIPVVAAPPRRRRRGLGPSMIYPVAPQAPVPPPQTQPCEDATDPSGGHPAQAACPGGDDAAAIGEKTRSSLLVQDIFIFLLTVNADWGDLTPRPTSHRHVLYVRRVSSKFGVLFVKQI